MTFILSLFERRRGRDKLMSELLLLNIHTKRCPIFKIIFLQFHSLGNEFIYRTKALVKEIAQIINGSSVTEQKLRKMTSSSNLR